MYKKRPDSTYTLGKTSLCTDKPTRAKLNAAAAAAGVTTAEYLRILADASFDNKQGALTLNVPVAGATMAGIAGTLKAIMTRMDAWEHPTTHQKGIGYLLDGVDAAFWHALGLESTEETKEWFALKVEEYKARDAGQLTWGLIET